MTVECYWGSKGWVCERWNGWIMDRKVITNVMTWVMIGQKRTECCLISTQAADD